VEWAARNHWPIDAPVLHFLGTAAPAFGWSSAPATDGDGLCRVRAMIVHSALLICPCSS
jgi:hypothetical protein